MDPLKVSAQFAAYLWFTDRHANRPNTAEEAARFSSDNWVAFLPAASEGMGNALLRIAAHREAALQRRRRPVSREEFSPSLRRRRDD